MMAEQQFRDTLYHQFANLEEAIIRGKLVEISRYIDIYGDSSLGIQTVWPLQLIYHDIAWYLLYENYDNGQLIIGRVSRFKNYCRILDSSRSVNSQRESLKKACKLLKNGWGLKLGSLEEQKEELDSKQGYIPIQIRFYPPISYFIQEGELRHPQQKLKLGKRDPSTKKPQYVDYCINLPPRSLDEFMIWVQRYADKAQVLSPPELAETHYQKALALVERYRIG
jgi:predicted RNase H-like HicB family nuclease